MTDWDKIRLTAILFDFENSQKSKVILKIDFKNFLSSDFLYK